LGKLACPPGTEERIRRKREGQMPAGKGGVRANDKFREQKCVQKGPICDSAIVIKFLQ